MGTDQEKNVKIVTPEKPSVTVISKDEISTEIDFVLTKQLQKIGIWVVSGVGILILGTIIGAVYTLNGQINKLEGSSSYSGKAIEDLTENVRKLQDDNRALVEKIHTFEIEKLKEDINRLDTLKN